MKKNITLLLSFIWISIFSQYTFDYKFYVKDLSKGSDKIEYDTGIYINSKNEDYKLYHYQNDEIRLFDYKIKCTFYFQQELVKDKKIFKFIDKGCFSGVSNERKINRIEITELSNNIYLIRTFPSERSKKANLELKVVLEKSDEDLLCLYKLDLSNNIHQKILTSLRDKLISLKGDSKYIIKEFERNYKNGYGSFTTVLSNIEKINMVIN